MARTKRLLLSMARIVPIALIAVAITSALMLIFQSVFCPFHVVVSDSMAPQIKTGDAIVVKDIETDEVKVGQVVIFRDSDNENDFIIHRVVGIEDLGYAKMYTTKGDNNPEPDPNKIPTGEIVGGVSMRLPQFGFFLNFLETPKGYVACAAIPAAIALFLVFLQSIWEVFGRVRDPMEDGVTS